VDLFGFPFGNYPSISEVIKIWGSMKKDWRATPLLALWGIWKRRNGKIFSSKVDTSSYVTDSIVALYYSLDIHGKINNIQGRNYESSRDRYESSGRPRSSSISTTPCAYFDGAAQQGICACGVVISIENAQAIEICWNAGPGTNNRAEAMALAGLLTINNFLEIQKLQIFGDSKVITEHVLSKHQVKNIHIAGWLDRIAVLWRKGKDYHISHIDRHKNKKADALSKLGLTLPQG